MPDLVDWGSHAGSLVWVLSLCVRQIALGNASFSIGGALPRLPLWGYLDLVGLLSVLLGSSDSTWQSQLILFASATFVFCWAHQILAAATALFAPLCLAVFAVTHRADYTLRNAQRAVFYVSHPTKSMQWNALLATRPVFYSPKDQYVAAIMCFKRLGLPPLPVDLRRLLWTDYVRDAEYKMWAQCKISAQFLDWIIDDEQYVGMDAITVIDGNDNMRIVCSRGNKGMVCVVDGARAEYCQEHINAYVLQLPNGIVGLRLTAENVNTGQFKDQLSLYQGALAKHGIRKWRRRIGVDDLTV